MVSRLTGKGAHPGSIQVPHYLWKTCPLAPQYFIQCNTLFVNMQYTAISPLADQNYCPPLSSFSRTNLVLSLTQPMQTNRNTAPGGGDEHNGEGRLANLDGEHHHVGLDLLRYALGPRLRHLQPHRARGVRRRGEHRRHQREGQRRRHGGRSPEDFRFASSGKWGELRQSGLLSEFLRGVHVTWCVFVRWVYGKWDRV
jgi:hypothetical protein